MKAQVYCRARKGLTLTFDVASAEADVGRDSSAAVSLPVEGVSRRHARITWDGKSHWIQDLKSTNGTFVNGEIVRRERLRHLDVITLGKAVNLIYVLRGEDYAPVNKQGIVAARLVPLAGDAAPYALPVGETTLGRSEACNLISDKTAVSKMHARIERTASRLTLEDLGSSNGTLVNRARTRSAVLRHGDEVSLAGVEAFRVEVETGEISAPSGIQTGPPRPGPAAEDEGPDFSSDWKTRFEWGTDEMEELKKLQQKLAARSAVRRGRAADGTSEPRSGEAESRKGPARARKGEPPKGEPPKAEPPKAEPPKAEPPKGEPPRAEPPRAEPPRAEPPRAEPPRAEPPKPEPPRAESPKATPSKAAPPRAEPPEPAPPKPAPPRAAPSRPAPPKAEPARAAPPSDSEDAEATIVESAPSTSRIVEVRLVAPSFDLVASTPGEFTIGRSSEAALRVVHPTVSRKHARLIVSDDRLKAFIQHDGGANGTRHNDREIDRIEELADGDRIEVGDVKLRVLVKRL